MIITVFGAGQPSDDEYELAYDLGKRIGRAGHTVKNGGYTGVMEGVSKGCSEQGGKVIGVCIKGDFNNRVKPNEFLSEKIVKDNMLERIKELLKTDAVIVLPGRIGTLEELFVTWSLFYFQDKGMIYVVGEKNKKLIEFLIENDFVDKESYLKYLKIINKLEDINFLKSR